MKIRYIWVLVLGLLVSGACQSKKTLVSDVLEKVGQELPLLGHRNWIVVTDMAYPLQTNPGVVTYYTDWSYPEVIRWVQQKIDAMPHVYAHVFRDEEYRFLEDGICPGIDGLKKEVAEVLPEERITFCPHDELLNRMDSVSQQYRVIVIKTPLLKPYTSVFWELDCKYWDQEKQRLLKMNLNELSRTQKGMK